MSNGNGNGIVWRSAIGILVAVLSFLSAFMFNKVVSLPETYIKIPQSKEMHQSQEKKIEHIEQKIDDGFNRIQEQYIEINKYLRDRAARDRRIPDGG